MNKVDELDEIFVEKNETEDKKLVVDILKPLVTIDNQGNISFKDAYNSLDEMKKALIYLVCKKAILLRGIEGFVEPSGPAEVSKGAFISISSAKNALCTHYNKFLKKEKEGYIVLNHNLRKIKELLLK
jgi:hypothetical protein